MARWLKRNDARKLTAISPNQNVIQHIKPCHREWTVAAIENVKN
jgi:hypothetical protein